MTNKPRNEGWLIAKFSNDHLFTCFDDIARRKQGFLAILCMCTLYIYFITRQLRLFEDSNRVVVPFCASQSDIFIAICSSGTKYRSPPCQGYYYMALAHPRFRQVIIFNIAFGLFCLPALCMLQWFQGT